MPAVIDQDAAENLLWHFRHFRHDPVIRGASEHDLRRMGIDPRRPKRDADGNIVPTLEVA